MMKLSVSLFRLMSMLALAAPAAAQYVPPPHIDSVPSRPAFDTGRVRILGSNLGLVYQVRIDGVEVPIFSNNGVRLTVGPFETRDPGFFPLEILSPLGSDTATVEFTPSLIARRRLGTSLRVKLHAGDTGVYVLRATYQPYAVGVPVPGVHYQSFIDLGAATSTVLQMGAFPDAETVTLDFLRPYYVGFIGEPITLQAQCLVGEAMVPSFTNVVAVP